MQIEKLVWDSEFFGFPVGKVRLNNHTDFIQLEEFLHHAPFRVVYIFTEKISNGLFCDINSIASLFDLKVTYSKGRFSHKRISHEVLPYEGELTEDLLSLTFISGQYSRFQLDPSFNPWFTELYKTWIEKSLSGEIADIVYVTRSGSLITGFITLVKKGLTGQIGLIAVHPDYRSMGIASSLMMTADSWYIKQGCENAIVVTQSNNKPACRLYERYDYKICSEEAIFHYWSKHGAFK